jgi:uncharacterized protein
MLLPQSLIPAIFYPLQLTSPSPPSRLEHTTLEGFKNPMAKREVLLKVEAVALDWKGNPIVVLREKDGTRAIFIWVGIPEATAISMHLEGQQAPRPMTHDLITAILEEVQVTVDRINITDMKGNTYFATLVLRDGEATTELDCRPSDAIAVAVRANAPIFIGEKLLQRLEEQRKENEIELSPGSTLVEPGEPMVH